MQRLMIVDDEKHVLSALNRICRGQKSQGQKESWQIETFNDPQQALKRAQSTCFDLFLSDYRMPEMNGVEFLISVKQLQPEAIRIILSGQTDREGLIDAINEAQIYYFMNKPWYDSELLTILHNALSHHDVLKENLILANQVREQQKELEQRKRVLEEYKARHPELFKIEWDTDGSIILNEGD